MELKKNLMAVCVPGSIQIGEEVFYIDLAPNEVAGNEAPQTPELDLRDYAVYSGRLEEVTIKMAPGTSPDGTAVRNNVVGRVFCADENPRHIEVSATNVFRTEDEALNLCSALKAADVLLKEGADLDGMVETDHPLHALLVQYHAE